MDMLPDGLWPVALTPFTPSGAIDLPGLDALVDWYLEQGAAGLFAICQSSEMDQLEEDEKLAILARTLARTAGRIPVVAAGMSQPSLDQRVAYARRLQDMGVAAVVVIANRLVPETAQEGAWWRAMEQLLEASGTVPLGVYECPEPHLRLLSPALVARCAASGRFRFMKETSCERATLAAKVRAASGTPLRIYNAHTPGLLAGLRQGAAGCSNIAGNFVPELLARLCREWRLDDDGAEGLQQLLAILDAHCRIGYPGAAKRWLQRRGLPIEDRCRVAVEDHRGDDEALRFAAMEELLHGCWSAAGLVAPGGRLLGR